MAMEIVKGCPSTSGDDYQLNLITLLRHAARTYPEIEIVSKNLDGSLFRYDYARAYERVQRLANALEKLGIKPGDRIGALDWNTHRFFELFFGIGGMGAVLLQINPRISFEDRAYVINHSEAKWIVISDTLLPVIEYIAPQLKTVQGYIIVTDRNLSDISTGLSPVYSYEELLREASPTYKWPMMDERSACSACYTTGTTGKPKGVYYSHRCLYLHTLMISLLGKCSTEDVIMQITPMFHASGWGLFFGAVLVGAKLVLPGMYTLETAGQLIDLLISEKVTVTCGAPAIFMPMLEAIRKLDKKPDLTGLRMFSGATEPPISMMKGYWELGNAEVVHAYGATETTPLATGNVLKRSLLHLSEEERWELRKKQGLPVTGLDIIVVGPDGQEVPHDGKTVGEILIKGPWITTSYYNDPRSEVSFTDGYWRSGDAGTIDEFGYVKVTDRFKDLIKSGGEWISSIDLENAIMGHPAVLEAVVVGLPHPKWEERPLALAVLRPEYKAKTTKEDILESLKGKFAKWQLPDEVLFVDEIPKTSVGKFAKGTIREQYGDLYMKS